MQVMDIHPIALPTVGELRVAFRHHVPIALQRRKALPVIPIIPTNEIDLLILLASILERPVQELRIEDQEGQFFVVNYQLVGGTDPEILLTTLPCAYGFHKTMRAFQEERAHLQIAWETWYNRVREQAERVISELGLLKPHPAEAQFAIRWLAFSLANGRVG